MQTIANYIDTIYNGAIVKLIGGLAMSTIVAVKKTKGVQYVSIVEVTSIKVNGVKKQKQKTIKSLGPLDKLLEKDPDALTKLRKEYQTPTLKYREQRADLVEKHIKGIDITQADLQRKTVSISLNYGLWALKPLWDNVLTLKRHIYYIQNSKSSVQFDVNAVLSYLTFLKVVDPKSQFKAFNHQTKFLCSPLKDIGLHDLYRALGFAHKFKDEIFIHIHNRICDNFNRSMTMVFYDCTNCYFESPYDDKQLLERKVINYIKAQKLNDGMSLKEFEEYINSHEFSDAFTTKFNEAIDDGEQLVRMHGLSKEHRFDLPLISVALVIDDKGIPIDFEIFAGNTSEYKTLPVLIEQMKSKYDIKTAVVVADRGLNSLGNLLNLLDHKLGFIVAQKVTALSSELESQMLDLESYTKTSAQDTNIQASDVSFIDIFDENLDYIDKEINTYGANNLYYRKLPYVKSGYITDPSTGKKLKEKVECQIVFTFSESRKKRDIAQLESDIIKARKAVEDQKDMAPVCSSGWRSIVQVKVTDADSAQGKKESLYIAKGLKEELIKKRRRLAGFSAMVYKKPEDIKEELNDADILSSYKKLVRIEDCFRVMKSNFSIRPMFVRNKEHISGHITICVMALILLRILQIKIEESGNKLSVDEISSALRNANIVAHSSNGIDGYFTNAQCHDNIYSIENTKIDPLDPMLTPIDRYINKLKNGQSHIDIILKSVNLASLIGAMNAKDVARSLKVFGGYEQLVGADNCKIQSYMAQA